jgi:NAD(P)-dependent dehydrogenase (short-subunit alcohol dehydrogenase family)
MNDQRPSAGATTLTGRGAVVTGAGHGIGRALARRLAAAGATVVVNDLDEAAAKLVAEEIGGVAAPGDCASAEGARLLLDRACEHLERVDVFCANAGIDRRAPDSLQTSDADWTKMLDTNVLAHVRAARILVPRWLSDGRGGRFVVTASAAGLLTALGAAPYSVTKHASVGFAEWLSATYGHRGIVVQAICPQSVETRMLEQGSPIKDLLPPEDTISPDDVAASWMASLDDDRFLVLPHPQVARFYAARVTDTDRWLAGMRRLQRKIDERTAPGRS